MLAIADGFNQPKSLLFTFCQSDKLTMACQTGRCYRGDRWGHCTKYHRPGDLNTETYSHSLEARSPRSRCWQGWLPLSPLSLACRWLRPCCLFAWSSLCAWASCCPPGVQISSSCKDSSWIGLGPTLMAHCNLITSLKTLSPNTIIFWDSGVKAST